MTTFFHRQFFIKTDTLLALFFCVTISQLFAQADSAENDYEDSNPFEHRQLHFTTFDSNTIKTIIPKINIQKTNVICYQDSFWADTIRLAYSTKDKNRWVTFATQFNNIPVDYNLINIDDKGQPEIVVRGTIFSEYYPHGKWQNDAIIIYEIDNMPIQIFKMFYLCSEFITPNYQGEGGFDYSVEREVKIENGEMVIEKLNTDNLDEEEKEWFKGRTDCHFTDIQSGTYKLINGQFKRQ